VRNARVWRALLGVEKTVVEHVESEEERDDGEDVGGRLVAHVRPTRAAHGRCGVCRRRCGR
jgi:transposase